MKIVDLSQGNAELDDIRYYLRAEAAQLTDGAAG